MGNKSGKRWNADHIVTTNTLVMINRKLLGAVMTDTTSLRLSQMPKKVNLRWNIDSPQRCTLPPPLPGRGALCGNDTRLLPKTRGPHEYSCRPTLLETQQNSLRSAPRNPRCARTHKYTRAVQYACVVLLLSVSLVFLWHPAGPRTSNCRKCNAHAHARTPIHLHAFMFTRSGRWILRALHFFFFLREALCSAKPDTVCSIIQHQPGRAVGCYSNVCVSLDSLWWIHFRTAASPSHYWPINPAHTLGL